MKKVTICVRDEIKKKIDKDDKEEISKKVNEFLELYYSTGHEERIKSEKFIDSLLRSEEWRKR